MKSTHKPNYDLQQIMQIGKLRRFSAVVSRRSGDLKAQLCEYIKIDDLNEKIQGTIASYLATMHNLSEGTKEVHLVRFRRLGPFLDGTRVQLV